MEKTSWWNPPGTFGQPCRTLLAETRCHSLTCGRSSIWQWPLSSPCGVGRAAAGNRWAGRSSSVSNTELFGASCSVAESWFNNTHWPSSLPDKDDDFSCLWLHVTAWQWFFHFGLTVNKSLSHLFKAYAQECPPLLLMWNSFLKVQFWRRSCFVCISHPRHLIIKRNEILNILKSWTIEHSWIMMMKSMAVKCLQLYLWEQYTNVCFFTTMYCLQIRGVQTNLACKLIYALW